MPRTQQHINRLIVCIALLLIGLQQSVIAANSTDEAVPQKAAQTQQSQPDDINFGSYHALIIANQNYDSLIDHPTAESDAQLIAQTLSDQFGFKTTIVRNASQKKMLGSLEQLKVSLTSKDNVLIYYLGHQYFDPIDNSEHWLPRDAQLHKSSSWIPKHTLFAILERMPAKHVLIVNHDCPHTASTALQKLRALPHSALEYHSQWLKAQVSVRVRAMLCINKTENTPPSQTKAHSSLTSLLTSMLANIDEPTNTYRLLQRIEQELALRKYQHGKAISLAYTPIMTAGHQAGEFIFVPVGDK